MFIQKALILSATYRKIFFLYEHIKKEFWLMCFCVWYFSTSLHGFPVYEKANIA